MSRKNYLSSRILNTSHGYLLILDKKGTFDWRKIGQQPVVHSGGGGVALYVFQKSIRFIQGFTTSPSLESS